MIYYIAFLDVLEVLFILTLFVHFQCLDQQPTDNIINQVLIPQII